MKASQLAKIESLKMRAEADKAWDSRIGDYESAYNALNQRAEEMAVLALEFEQEERAEAGK